MGKEEAQFSLKFLKVTIKSSVRLGGKSHLYFLSRTNFVLSLFHFFSGTRSTLTQHFLLVKYPSCLLLQTWTQSLCHLSHASSHHITNSRRNCAHQQEATVLLQHNRTKWPSANTFCIRPAQGLALSAAPQTLCCPNRTSRVSRTDTQLILLDPRPLLLRPCIRTAGAESNSSSHQVP